ncbi:MAG: 2-polyprenyl-3-methyl-5-hydroxy-6-metoxy-1,4-benzoquinol methylase [Patiriisocius sp.]|jgi:2-polyprenyl-3-methyl-5-hydroxy-6-metoxy-1,4-benzoquinol methylase
MKDIWDERFGAKEYAFGREPNAFFKKELDKLPKGKLLLPAEGEGRNAVYAASKGWEVVAFDTSVEGLRKAQKLAERAKVSIDYRKADLEDFRTELGSFDCLALIYAHMPFSNRQKIHKRLINYLKEGGVILLEGFSKNQLSKKSGGPQSEFLLFSEAEIKEDFEEISELNIQEVETKLSEGKLHKGEASVIRMIGIK